MKLTRDGQRLIQGPDDHCYSLQLDLRGSMSGMDVRGFSILDAGSEKVGTLNVAENSDLIRATVGATDRAAVLAALDKLENWGDPDLPVPSKPILIEPDGINAYWVLAKLRDENLKHVYTRETNKSAWTLAKGTSCFRFPMEGPAPLAHSVVKDVLERNLDRHIPYVGRLFRPDMKVQGSWEQMINDTPYPSVSPDKVKLVFGQRSLLSRNDKRPAGLITFYDVNYVIPFRGIPRPEGALNVHVSVDSQDELDRIISATEDLRRLLNKEYLHLGGTKVSARIHPIDAYTKQLADAASTKRVAPAQGALYLTK
jgi:hypothetical protein